MVKEFVSILKSVLIALILTLVGVVIFAVVLKFVDLPQNVVSYINDILKVISIFFMVLLIKKHSPNKVIARVIIGSVLYAILTFVIFSIIGGGFSFSVSLLYDILFVVIAGVIVTIITNLLPRKRV